MISPMIDEIGAIVGGSTSGGRLDRTDCRRSDTSWRARKMSVLQSNSAQITEFPIPVEDLTRRTPDAPLSAVSIG